MLLCHNLSFQEMRLTAQQWCSGLQSPAACTNEIRVSKVKLLSDIRSNTVGLPHRWHNRSMSLHILVVEDDQATATLVAESLQDEGWSSTLETDGEQGLRMAQSGNFDALVLDIMLPGRNGLSVVRRLRELGQRVPVLILSARGDLEQRVQGLEAGADDYLPKPYARSELIARLRSITRRVSPSNKDVLTVADLEFRPATHATSRAGSRINLSSRECRLLECLLRAEGAVVSRRDIIEAVWGYDFDPGTNLVEVYIRRLRLKVEPPGSIALIHTIRGLGYALRILP
jgi:DNA-binding response OmpR family regulator